MFVEAPGVSADTQCAVYIWTKAEGLLQIFGKCQKSFADAVDAHEAR